MKERKGMVPILVVIALFVWGSNFYRLVIPGQSSEIQLSEIPEVPAHLTEDALEYQLPELTNDPFNSSPIAPNPQQNRRRAQRPNPQPAKPRVVPPRVQLQMIHERAGKLIALFQMPGQPDSQVFAQGEVVENWTIEKITFNSVELKNKEGQEHVLRIGPQ